MVLLLPFCSLNLRHSHIRSWLKAVFRSKINVFFAFGFLREVSKYKGKLFIVVAGNN